MTKPRADRYTAPAILTAALLGILCWRRWREQTGGTPTLRDTFRKRTRLLYSPVCSWRRLPMAIKIKKANKGKLRKTTKTKKGAKIPVSKLNKLKASKNPKTRKRATFALNARKFRKGGKKKR